MARLSRRKHAAVKATVAEAVQRILEHGQRVLAFRESCAKKQGGSEFSSRVREWLGMSDATASRWCRIGEAYEKLFPAGKSLPLSWRLISEIADLPGDVIEPT